MMPRNLTRMVLALLMLALALPAPTVRAAPGADDRLPTPDESLLQAEPVRAARELREGLSTGQRRSLSAAIDRYKPQLDAVRARVKNDPAGDMAAAGHDKALTPPVPDRKADAAKLKDIRAAAQDVKRITAQLDAEIVGLLTPAQREAFKKGKARANRDGAPRDPGDIGGRAEAPTADDSQVVAGSELAPADLTMAAVDSAGEVYLSAQQNLTLGHLVTLTAGPAVAQSAHCSYASYYTQYARYYTDFARQSAYYDYLAYGGQFAYYGYVYLYWADYDADFAAYYLAGGFPRQAEAYMFYAYQYANTGFQYESTSYQLTGNPYAYYGTLFGYLTYLNTYYATYYFSGC